MARAIRPLLVSLALVVCLLADQSRAGIIKNIFHKITNTGDKSDDQVKQSVPICGSGLFSTSNENTISPEFIFITSSASRTLGNSNSNRFARSPQRDRNYGSSSSSSSSNYQSGQGGGHQSGRESNSGSGGRSESGRVSEVAREFRFNVENVTLAELEEHGFNPNAPVTFLMHGFTSGYPLQAWISAIVEAYTIDRESTGGGTPPSSAGSSSSGYGNSGFNGNTNSNGYGYGGNSGNNNNNNNYGRENYENVSSHNQGGDYRRNRRAAAARGNSTASAHNNSTMSAAVAANNETVAQSRSLSSTSSSPRRGGGGSQSGRLVSHNLFIINWNYAARGILYPRAVANIPKVATFATRFINDKLLDEARVDPRRIQLIGHSLGAHLAGFIGKNTRTRLGRIYGLDPAGPCFGSGVRDLLYPAGQRLAPSDADEVIAISTNSALLGIDKPLGRYSVFVEGGANQPGCKQTGVLKSIGVLTWDGGDFDTLACSHSRAPNLMTYRHDQSNKEDNCELVAYACKDWDSFTKGFCGVCDKDGREGGQNGGRTPKRNSPLDPVECLRVGLDWQYPGASNSGGHSSSSGHTNNYGGSGTSTSGYSSRPTSGSGYGGSSTRRPSSSSSNYGNGGSSGSNYGGSEYGASSSSSSGSRRPYSGTSSAAYTGRNYNNNNNGGGGLYPSLERVRRAEHSRRNESSSSASTARNEYRNATTSDAESSPLDQTQMRGLFGSSSSSSGGRRDAEVEPTVMFIRTGDTQPYCTFHYQVVLELNEPFPKKDPPMAIILQDSEPTGERSRQPTSAGNSAKSEQNSLSNDEFGKVFNDRTYTHLLTSNKKLKRIDHATMIFRNGLRDGHRVLKTLHVNYMSHSDPGVRQRLSSRLCPVKTDTDRPGIVGDGENRFFFKPCDRVGQSSSSSSSHSGNSGNSGRENNNNNSYGRDNENSSTSQSGHNGGSSSGYNQRDRETNSGYGNNNNNNGGRENSGSSSTGSGRDRDNYGSTTSGSGSGRHKHQQPGGSGSNGSGSSSSNYGRENNSGQYGFSSTSASSNGRDRDRENNNNNNNYSNY